MERYATAAGRLPDDARALDPRSHRTLWGPAARRTSRRGVGQPLMRHQSAQRPTILPRPVPCAALPTIWRGAWQRRGCLARWIPTITAGLSGHGLAGSGPVPPRNGPSSPRSPAKHRPTRTPSSLPRGLIAKSRYWREKSLTLRDPGLAYPKTDPRLDPLRAARPEHPAGAAFPDWRRIDLALASAGSIAVLPALTVNLRGILAGHATSVASGGRSGWAASVATLEQLASLREPRRRTRGLRLVDLREQGGLLAAVCLQVAGPTEPDGLV